MSDSRTRVAALLAKWWPLLVMAYAATVLGIDALATEGVEWPWDWAGLFTWSSLEVRAALTWARVPSWITAPLGLRFLSSFDWFKFLLWLVVPFVISLRHMDWRALGPMRWKRVDIGILAGIALIGILAMMLIPHLPDLRRIYPDYSSRPDDFKIAFFVSQLVWIVSWLPGWEFLHRYALLRAGIAKWPRFGWLLVPLFEGIYHLQKPIPEMAGMVLFSLVMTLWALRRRNVLLPFLCHLIIEVELVLFLLF